MESKKITIAQIKLSGNPDTKVEKDVNGINGEVNVSSDGRKFVMLLLEDRTDPFKYTRRNFMYSTNEEGVWPASTPKAMLETKNKLEAKGETYNAEGETYSSKVEPYFIGDNEISSYSTIVLAKENVDRVFTNAGHPRINEEGELIIVSKLPQKVTS